MGSSKKIHLMVECAIMVALATVLSLIKVWEMPLGGSITLLSMLPICYFSVKNGIKWGFICSFFYAVVQIAVGLPSLMSWGMTAEIWVGCIVFDYLLAFGSLGIAGIFGNKGIKPVAIGITLALILRFFSHLISGCIFFDMWIPETWKMGTILYSISYNGAYMLPELIFTVIAAVLIHPYLTKFIEKHEI